MAALLGKLVKEVIKKAAKSPAVRRKAAQVAQKARSVFNSSKKRVTQLCETVARRLQGKKSVEEVLKKATGRSVVKDKSIQYPMRGGFKQANKDFDSLIKGKAESLPGGKRTGKLPDGRSISVRPNSTTEKPTIQIEPFERKGKKVKLRYDN